MINVHTLFSLMIGNFIQKCLIQKAPSSYVNAIIKSQLIPHNNVRYLFNARTRMATEQWILGPLSMVSLV